MVAQHFEELDCWQLAHELKREVFAFTAKMPAKADRDFCHDIRRFRAIGARKHLREVRT